MLLKCDFCGKEKEQQAVCIIASKENAGEWVACIEGSGKTACPECYPKASRKGQANIDRYIENHNRKAEGN